MVWKSSSVSCILFILISVCFYMMICRSIFLEENGSLTNSLFWNLLYFSTLLRLSSRHVLLLSECVFFGSIPKTYFCIGFQLSENSAENRFHGGQTDRNSMMKNPQRCLKLRSGLGRDQINAYILNTVY